MDNLAETIETIKSRIAEDREVMVGSETRTKTVLIEPLLRALGWDVSEPKKVLTEYHSTVFGIKSGERVDYALMKNGEPNIVVEAKYPRSPAERPHPCPSAIWIFAAHLRYSWNSN